MKYTRKLISLTNNFTPLTLCTGKKLIPEKSLAQICPKAVSHWDTTKNDVGPEEISVHTHRKCYFICKECGNSFERRLNKFALGKRICVKCSRKNQKKVTNPESWVSS